MHQTRAQVTKKIPIPRKGTKYVARALSNLDNSVPVVVAVRDMLKLARTSKEVKEMIKEKVLKLNGREIKDERESIKLFNVLQADKTYVLTFSPIGKFTFEEIKSKERLAKVIGKKILSGKKTQINLHDGTNILSNEKIKIGDSVYIDSNNKIAKHVSLEKGKECFVISGKYVGKKGKIHSLENDFADVHLEGNSVKIEKGRLAVL